MMDWVGSIAARAAIWAVGVRTMYAEVLRHIAQVDARATVGYSVTASIESDSDAPSARAGLMGFAAMSRKDGEA